MIGDDLVPETSVRGPDDIVPAPLTRAPLGSPLLTTARALLRVATELSPLPVGRGRVLWVLPRPAGHGVAELYVLVWMAGLVACLVIAEGDAGPFAAGVAWFRAGDLALAQALVLLDPVGTRLGESRRVLLLIGLHVVEMVLIVGTVSRWIVGERLGSAFVTGLDVVTFQAPGRQVGNWVEAVRVGAVLVMALLLVRVVVTAIRMARER